MLQVGGFAERLETPLVGLWASEIKTGIFPLQTCRKPLASPIAKDRKRLTWGLTLVSQKNGGDVQLARY